MEVKGTTTNGHTIVVTYNEVMHAKNNSNACVLFVLHSIQLNGEHASGGKRNVIHPWNPDQGTLKPITYTYRS